MMTSSLALFLTLVQLFCVTTSSPLGPPGSEDPGKDYAIPYHTTNHYIISKLKSFYSYLFNKPESVHEDGYTKVHVMGKHMYYTYTHEYTQGDGQPRDANGTEHIQRQQQAEEEAKERLRKEDEKRKLEEEGIFKKTLRNIPILRRFVRDVSVSVPSPFDSYFKPVTEDRILRDYLKDENLAKQHKETVQAHIQRIKQLEEEAKERWRKEFAQKEKEEKEREKEGILKKTLRNIPILNRFVRDISTIRPPNGVLKEGLKKIVETVWGDPPPNRPKVSQNWGKKISETISKAGSNAASAFGEVKVGLKEGVKSVAKGTVNLLGQMLIPRGIREGWPAVKDALGKMVLKTAEHAPFLHIFIPGIPPDYWPNPPPERADINIKYPLE